jgi:RimJ/RimL family protein N-acetyltransferase
MTFPLITSISSRRLALRPVAAADLPQLLAINADEAVTRFLPYPRWQSLQDGEAWLARMEALVASGSGRQLVLARHRDGAVLGSLLLFRYDEGSARVELGYVLGRQHWGHGLMREAVAAACLHAFDRLGLRRIEAEVNPANVASCRLLTDLGFTLEGVMRQRWVAAGQAYDTCFYGLLAQDRPAVLR